MGEGMRCLAEGLRPRSAFLFVNVLTVINLTTICNFSDWTALTFQRAELFPGASAASSGRSARDLSKTRDGR